MSRHKPYALTKSSFMSGRQCKKRLYLEVQQRGLATPPNALTQAAFELGRRVGRYAHDLYPGGTLVDVPPAQPYEALRHTRSVMEDTTAPAIFEGAFLFENVFVRADILVRQADDRWLLAECKAAAKVKSEHLWDLALQAHVLRGMGVKLAAMGLVHLDSSYVYDGRDYQVERLLRLVEMTHKVDTMARAVNQKIKEMKRVLDRKKAPIVEPGPHCHTPYPCPYWAHCTSMKPARWIGFLPDGTRQIPRLVTRGVETFDEIPFECFLTEIQEYARREAELVGKSLQVSLAHIQFPLHHLHMEAGFPGLPLYKGMRPYQPFPFLWTNLVTEQSGESRVEEWLSLKRQDSRQACAETLLHSLGDQGTIVVYSDAASNLIEELAKSLPEQREALRSLRRRIVDLRHLIRKGYYHPQMPSAVYQRDHFATCASIHMLGGFVPGSEAQGSFTVEEGWAFREYLKSIEGPDGMREPSALRADLIATSRRLVGMLRDLRLYLEGRIRARQRVQSRESAA